ncbi:caspase-3-like [Mytilus californianus]|uniref:caspase-3-like n=1 Tax=Mytilus californianus TaxID=6549 RepID=UPI0022470AF9|nr:caspase-3-like [Mytilus californianus]
MSGNKQTFLDASVVHGDWIPPTTHARGPRPRTGPPITVAITKEEFDSKYYEIKSGLVLVLNNKEFRVTGENLGDRAGSDIDASTISQRFSELGFEYELETDLSKSTTIEWFERVKRQLITKPVDCFVLVVLSHGTENGVYATDQLMRIEEIVETFNATNCLPLRFKPKVVIIQSCRGTNLSHGINVGLSDPNRADAMGDPTEYNEWLGIRPVTQTIRLPNEADFLFAYATVPGAGAFRNAAEGTPFIRHLSKAIEDMEVNEDFYSVLTSVNKTVGMTYKPNNGEAEYNDIVQMPCFVSHFTKSLRLRQAR